MNRELIFFESYFIEFYVDLNPRIQAKIDKVLYIISNSPQIPEKFFKYLTGTDALYEIRIEYAGNIYRIFSFFDKGNLIILLNGIQKKSQKTPPKEIKKALKLKQKYFENKG